MKKIFADYTISLTDKQWDKFYNLMKFMLEYNKHTNLTRITEEKDVYIKHYLDSLLPLTMIDIPSGASVIDIGSGAGFPGIPLAIYRDDLKITMLDSTKKKTLYIEKACAYIGLDCGVVWGRAEEKKELFGKYDYAISRAVASMDKLYSWCMPYAKKGVIVMKGSADTTKRETALLPKYADCSTWNMRLPDGEERTICLLKQKQT